jgi:hypothetical protein
MHPPSGAPDVEERFSQRRVDDPSRASHRRARRACTKDQIARTKNAEQGDSRGGMHRMAARAPTAEADEPGDREQHTEHRGNERGWAGAGTGGDVRPTSQHDQ